MRFLKVKIMKAQEALRRNLAKSSVSTSSSNIKLEEITSPIVLQPEKKQSKLRNEKTYGTESPVSPKKKEDPATKNIAVNYANAITSFAISPLAVPYLQSRLQSEGITLKDFVSFINHEKTKIGGICSFRARLLIADSDTIKTAACKRMFQFIAEIFIKYFSVNWIIHGRVSHKDTYLKFRHKMLRRVQNPESFTYIKPRETKKH